MARKYFRSNSTSRSGLKAVCAALLLAFTAGPLFAQGLPFGTGPFLHVECDPPGADLQKTLDTAVSGSEIFIVGTCDDGPYRIHAKDLALVASSGGTGVILSGSGAEESVLDISGGSYVLLQGRPLQDFVVDAQGNDEGITVDNGSSVVIDTVTVVGAAGSGILIERGSSGIIVGESVFRNNGVGIQFRTNSAGIMTDDLVAGVYAGLLLLLARWLGFVP